MLYTYGDTEADYSTDVLSAKAVDFINRRAAARQKFFLVVSPNAPHNMGRKLGPLPAARHAGTLVGLPLPDYGEALNEADTSDKPQIVRAIPPMTQQDIANATGLHQAASETLLAVDDMIRDIMRAVAANKITNQTVVILTADNGLSFGAHRIVGKQVLYEDSIRVPLVIRGPGIPKNVERSHLVNNLDLAPTILNLARVKPPYALDGASLLPIIADPTTRWRRALLVQGTIPKHAHGRGTFFGVRTATNTYAEYSSKAFGTEYEFYRLDHDPLQLTNAVGQPKNVRRISGLSNLLRAFKTCKGRRCFIPERR